MNELLLWLGSHDSYEAVAGYLMAARGGQAAAAAEVPAYQLAGSTAIIEVRGSLYEGYVPRAYLAYGVMGYDNIRESVALALADATVTNILMVYDSPGGSATGVEDVSNFLMQARLLKPIVSYNSGKMMSAAAWLGSTGLAIYGTRSSMNGSVGVKMLHRDISKALEMQGVKYTVIRHGENKALGDPVEPLTEDVKKHFQSMAAKLGTMFEQAMADNLGMTLEAVQKKFEGGKEFLGEDALAVGLLTHIGNFEAALAHVRSLAPSTNRATTPTYRGQSPMKFTFSTAMVDKLKALGASDQDIEALASSPVQGAEAAPSPADTAVLQHVTAERDTVITQLANANIQLAEAKAAAEAAAAAQLAAEASSKELSEIAVEGIKSMATALNTQVKTEGTAAELAAEHKRISDLYRGKFRVGGSGVVTPPMAEPEGQKAGAAPNNLVVLALQSRHI